MLDRRCDCEYEHKLRTTEKRILYAIIAAIVAVLVLAVYVNTAHACPTDCPSLLEIDRETKLREEWQSRALKAEDDLSEACDLILTAYREQDELNGPWYTHAAARMKKWCGFADLDDPRYRGRDSSGFYNMDKSHEP